MSTTDKSTWLVKNELSWYHKLAIKVLKAGPIPRHIAFIMDGNRRFAKQTEVPLRVGHSQGFDKFSEIIYWCSALGIEEVTTYAFSIENFNRSPAEVETLMNLATEKFEILLEEIESINKNGICIRVIGNLSLLSKELNARIAKAVLLTKDNTKTVLNIALSYTSQDEIANSFEEIRKGLGAHKINEDDITEELISSCMYSGKSRKLDLLIRTSGEVRFSDFLLWQSWNANVIFHKVLWPVLDIRQFLSCIFYYQMCYGNQKQAMKLVNNDKSDKVEKVEEFLSELEKRRFEKFQFYESNL